MSMYPWDNWLDGRVWLVEQGVDYECMTNSLRAQAHKAAHDREGGPKHVATYVTEWYDGEPRAFLMQAYPEVSTWKPNLKDVAISLVRRSGRQMDNPRNEGER